MQWLMHSRSAVLGLMSAAGLLACGESSTPSTTDNSVDAAYSALVADVAKCGKQVKSCVEAAGTDATGIGSCREQFSTCRADAGKQAVSAMVSAVRDCTSRQNQCVQAAGHGEAGSCQDDLRVCLRAAHAAQSDNQADDADAGDEGGASSKPSDCLDELHSCVKADGAVKACAEKVRMCVVDSCPSAGDVVPDDSAERAGRGGGRASEGADAGAHGGRLMSAGRMCIDSLSACMDSGTAARSCAKSLRECREAAKP